MISAIHSCWFCSVYPEGVIAALHAFIHARLDGCAGSSLPERNQSKLYVNCQSYFAIVVQTEM